MVYRGVWPADRDRKPSRLSAVYATRSRRGDERVSRDAFEIMPTGNDIAAMPAEMRITPSYLTSHLVEQYLPFP